MGDHVYRRREIFSILQSERPLSVRPIIRPRPGPRFRHPPHAAAGQRGGFHACRPGVHAAGRLPLPAADRVLAALPPEVRVILVDFHAEATSDKQLMGRYLDGRVKRRAGHAYPRTHGRRADPARRHGVSVRRRHDRPAREHFGRRIDRVMETTRTFRPTHFEVATGDVRLNGTIVDVDAEPAGHGHPPHLRRSSHGEAARRGTGEGGRGRAWE